jgi:hypothetical protein
MSTSSSKRAVALIALVLSAGCGDDDGASGDAGDPDAGTLRDATGGSDAPAAPDAGGDAGATALSFLLPTAGRPVVHSTAIRLQGSEGIDRVEVRAAGDAMPRCTADPIVPSPAGARWFECLIDLDDVAPGAVTLDAVGFAGATEQGTATTTVMRRASTPACAAAADLACVNERVTAGTSAGFTGLTYACLDGAHARADTSGMPGIDAQVHDDFPAAGFPASAIVVMNMSRAWIPAGGSLSIPRPSWGPWPTRLPDLYRESKLAFFPEHRDHGIVDVYPGQWPWVMFSQGSSGSELDEVRKLLLTLGVLPADVRARLHETRTLGPFAQYVMRRSRVASDSAYLTPAGHLTVFPDADNTAAMLDLATAITAAEAPPVVAVEVTDRTEPASWNVRVRPNTPYARDYDHAGTAPTDTAGEMRILIDLTTSEDADGDTLVYFPRVVRGDAATVTLERLDETGTQWAITTPYPADQVVNLDGQDRTVGRVTIAFVAHDGTWLSAPSYVSVSNRDGDEPIPDSNNLD